MRRRHGRRRTAQRARRAAHSGRSRHHSFHHRQQQQRCASLVRVTHAASGLQRRAACAGADARCRPRCGSLRCGSSLRALRWRHVRRPYSGRRHRRCHHHRPDLRNRSGPHRHHHRPDRRLAGHAPLNHGPRLAWVSAQTRGPRRAVQLGHRGQATGSRPSAHPWGCGGAASKVEIASMAPMGQPPGRLRRLSPGGGLGGGLAAAVAASAGAWRRLWRPWPRRPWLPRLPRRRRPLRRRRRRREYRKLPRSSPWLRAS